MKNTLIRILSLITVLTLAVSLFAGCFRPTEYSGPYPQMCSLAWQNLIDVQGYWIEGELFGFPDVEILETDSYGRALFSYSEDTSYGDEEEVYLLIMQRKSDTTVSYYPEDCYYFVNAKVVDGKKVYDTEVIEALKLLNDWELPLDESKCESTDIVTKKPEGDIERIKDDAFLEQIVGDYYESIGKYIHPSNTSYVSHTRYVTEDDYGRELYTVYSRLDEYTGKCRTQYLYRFLLVLMPDGSCDTSTLILLDDPHNAQDAVRLIKEQNNWNKPIE